MGTLGDGENKPARPVRAASQTRRQGVRKTSRRESETDRRMRRSPDMGRALYETLSYAYAVMVVVVGISLSVMHFQSGSNNSLPRTGVAVSVFHVYMYAMSIIFLIYMFGTLASRRRREKKKRRGVKDEEDPIILVNQQDRSVTVPNGSQLRLMVRTESVRSACNSTSGGASQCGLLSGPSSPNDATSVSASSNELTSQSNIEPNVFGPEKCINEPSAPPLPLEDEEDNNIGDEQEQWQEQQSPMSQQVQQLQQNQQPQQQESYQEQEPQQQQQQARERMQKEIEERRIRKMVEAGFEDEDERTFTQEGHGVTLFLRIWIVVLGLGAFAQDALRLVQYTHEMGPDSDPCYGDYFIPHTGIRMAFITLQTFFIVKYNKLVAKFSEGRLRWGFLHLIVTNIVIWIQVLAVQITEDIYDHPDASSDALYNFWSEEDTIICHSKPSLADKSSPFLFAFIVQWCLLSVGVLCRISSQIGSTGDTAGWRFSRPLGSICHRAHTGVGIGLVVLAVSVVASFYYLVQMSIFTTSSSSSPSSSIASSSSAFTSASVSEPPTPHHPRRIVYITTHLCVICVAMVATLVAFCRLKGFSTEPHKRVLFVRFLFISLAGHCLLVCLNIGAFMNYQAEISDETTPKHVTLTQIRLELAMSFISILQAILQIPLIAYGLRMRAVDRRLQVKKPGRSTVTVLALVNTALWVIVSVQSADLLESTPARAFYGDLWVLIVHFCLPFTCLMRLLAAVTFTSIWLNAYKPIYDELLKRQTSNPL